MLQANVTDRLSQLAERRPPAMIWVSKEDLLPLALRWVGTFYCFRCQPQEPGLFGDLEPTQTSQVPCNQCESCVQLASGALGDVKRLRSENGKQIGVEDIRIFCHWIFLKGFQQRPRFGIIENAHDMSPAAQNAFLKVFEEVPPGLTLLLLTAQPDRLLPTIRSRAQLLRWALPSPPREPSDVQEEQTFIADFAKLLTLSRIDSAREVQTLTADAEWIERMLRLGPRVVQFLMEMASSDTLKKPVGAEYGCEALCAEIHLKRPRFNWLEQAERLEEVLMRRQRSAQLQLEFENYLYGLLL